MNKQLRAGMALMLAFFALPAVAEDEMRPYLSGGYDYIFQDDARTSDYGQGAFFGAGKPINQFWGFEFGGFYHGFEDNSNPSRWREYGGKVDALFFYSRNAAFSPYFGLGVGAAHTDLITAPTGSSTDPFVDVGLGFFKYFAVNGGPDLGLRADLRYRWLDIQDIPANTGTTVNEPVLRVGLVIPLGARVLPVAAVAPAAPSVPAANDADGDGVPDESDDCPGTPAGWLVDNHGCPMDSDHDGVPDNLDKCPDTAAGIAVDPTGCPVAVAGAARSFENVNFAFDRSDLSDYAKALLDNAASVINSLTLKYPSLKVDISGHTDWLGTDAYNQALSERRANAVREYLTRKGVDGSRISGFAYGETKPIAPNDTEEGRALNRRAEVRTHE